jgi:uncharacterized cupin superfamily protein
MANDAKIETKLVNLYQTPQNPPPEWNPDLRKVFREVWLGKYAGINQFGVNHVALQPGFEPTGNHWHEQEDEFIYVLCGEVTLIDNNGEHLVREGDFVGFPAGVPNAHCLANRSTAPATNLAIGARHRGRETVHYPREGVTRTVERDQNGMRVPGSLIIREGASPAPGIASGVRNERPQSTPPNSGWGRPLLGPDAEPAPDGDARSGSSGSQQCGAGTGGVPSVSTR